MNQKISKNQILNLKLFFDFLQEKEIENYILSNLCEFDENISPNYALKIELISGFSSSNSFLLFSSREQRKKIILITDTRYELSGKIYFDPDELKKESEIDFEIFLISRNKKLDFFEKICFEPKFFNQGIIDLLFLESCEKFLLEENIFEDFSKKICLNYENSQNISEPFLYSEEYSGETSELKIKRFFKSTSNGNECFYY